MTGKHNGSGELDALVVGAGPVGMTAAWELHRHGLSCRIVDKAAARSDKSKALVLWSRSLEMLHAMGGVEPFLAAGNQVHGGSLYANARRLVHLSFDSVESAYPFALMIPQSETERVLEERLAALGGPVERSVELVALSPDDDGVDATLRHADGREERVRSRWLLACDGAHSTVRHALASEFEGEAEPNDWILADVHARGAIAPDEVSIYFHSSGVCVFFPITPGRYRVIADMGLAQAIDRAPDPTLAQVRALVDERGPGGIELSDPVWLAGFRINERKVRNYRAARRVFLAGDAAHIHSPAGGQGMNTGMQDAFNLVWKIALVNAGRGREEPLLASYDAERGAIGALVLHEAATLTRLATLRHPLAQQVRNRALRFLGSLAVVQSQVATMLSEAAIGYPKSPLVGEHRGLAAHAWLLGGGVAPGMHMPDGELDDPSSGQKVRILDLLRTAVHRLFLLAGVAGESADGKPSAIDALGTIAAETVRRYGDAIAAAVVVLDESGRQAIAGAPHVLVDPDHRLHRALAAGGPTLVLVRPDGYVGFRSQPADPAELWRHLDRYLIAAA